ncbi:malonate decarboxylase subunit epsilon [Clostridium magnum]|uniref:Malonyl CoA-acyl carrier protein transacylase n=1 Tax=Clostridium magnum DSM 2767 TaxID=1121326 RepID=A0A162RQX8_9CLOT|nr:malonate decarboxylase subunit epsilon [Clostridium magnum]KZL90257.1 malonyl CoA-acyl carrier protein transacylase [Clostridium magnum DSM 2767]SHI13735.1 malonate decarboxylase epsilon subunit [Clostridium magnum DSM 2767]
MSTAFLFPGQGSQQPNMLHELPKHPMVTKTIEEASLVLGRDVLLLDTKESLLSTVSVQLSLLISGVAIARVLKSEGAVPDIVAGHSVGSFAAAVVSGALDFRDALSVVELRGKLMENSYPKGYGMGVIVGLDELRVSSLVDKVNTTDSPVFIANLNAQDQITIAGSISAIEAVFTLALSVGAHMARLLKVSVPSHCELLEKVSNEIASKMAAIPLKAPTALFIGNCRARVLRKAEEIGQDLSIGVANPVRWHEATTSMFERGVRLFVELGPGQTLTNMAKKVFPDARCISALNSGIESTLILMKRERDK